VAIHFTDGVADLSGHCWHVDREVVVRYWKLCTSAAGLMTPFQTLSSSGGGGISMQGQALHRHSTPVGR
jgi:hypothetical protein